MARPLIRAVFLAALLLLSLAAANDAVPVLQNNANGESAPTQFDEATVAQLQALMASGRLSS